jgi:hypothetical protein
MFGRLLRTDSLITLAAVLLAGTAPNLFVAAQAGYAKFSILGKFVLLPSAAALIVLSLAALRLSPVLGRRIFAGILAGIIATVGLELVREIGFHLGAMPGDLPKLMGVQLLDRFMVGPSLASNLAGWGYHFWNGASFGVIFTLLSGGRRWWAGPMAGTIIGVVFMASPAVTALGIGRFGVLMGPGFAVTVVLAHLAYGLILGALVAKWAPENGIIFSLFGGCRSCDCEMDAETAEKVHPLVSGARTRP